MTQKRLYVGLDVGGTTMKAGVVDDTGTPLSDVSLPTEPIKGQEHGLATMVATIRKAVAEAHLDLSAIAAIGVATPGTMDLKAGVILEPPNLKPWRNVPVRQYVANTFQLPTAFQNDANAAAFGEYWAGAGRGMRSLVLFTLGTGVGGGIILNDMVIEGEHSHGAELGHMKIETTHPRLCGCGRYGCLEAYASATSVVKRAQEALLAGYAQGTALYDLWRANEEFTAHEVFDAWIAGDELAGRIVDETAYYLGLAAANLMHVIDPEMVVFGGGMVAAGEPFLERIRWHVHRIAFPVPAAKCLVRFAQLGSDAGFIGAANCARQLVLK